MRVNPGELPFLAGPSSQAKTSRRFAGQHFQAQPGDWRVIRRPFARRRNTCADPRLNLFGEVLEGDGMEDHPSGSGHGLLRQMALDPVGGITLVDRCRPSLSQFYGGGDPGQPLRLIGPDVGKQALRILDRAEIDSAPFDDFYLGLRRRRALPLGVQPNR